jgi:competence ComEA-like helix-hairpin-helix protein
MKFRFRREWFFLTEKLQITPAERTAVTTMMVLLVVMFSIPADWFRSEPFDAEYYAPVLAEFRERVEHREREQAALLARFYPEPASSDIAILTAAGTTPDAMVPAVADTGRTAGGPAGTAGGGPGSNTPGSTSPGTIGPGRVDTGAAAPSDTAAVKVININTAGVAELVQLPGIGPAIAARIVEYREQNGPFRRIEDITGVRGIGEARLNSLRSRIKTE